MTYARRWVALALAAAGCGGAAAQEPEPGMERPKYTLLRFDEDWSVLKDGGDEGDVWDPVKYVPLSKDGEIWASFGGSARLRWESWRNFGFLPSATGDDDFLLWRLLLHGDLHLGEHVRVFVQGKSSLATDRQLPGGKRIVDVDAIDLEQAFVDVRIPLDGLELTLRPGRQHLLLGKQRLVSPLEWSNTLRRWDGVSAVLEWERWTVHGFWAQFVPVRKYDFNQSDAQTQLYGVYASGSIPGPDLGVDAYFLGLDRDDPVTVNGTTGTERRYTLGGRLSGRVGESSFDYDFEGAYQFGEVGPGDVSAFMIGSQFGYTAASLWSSPRFFAGFDYGSGDDAFGGDVETFNQLFPLGHAYLGYIDAIGRQNIVDLSLGVDARPLEKLSARVAGHFFWRDSTADALYNAAAVAVKMPGSSGSSEVGQEIDVTVSYRFDRHTTALIGYSHFFAGSFVQGTPPANDTDFLYLQLQYTF